MTKMYVYKGYELTIDGVTQVWKWKCYYLTCKDEGVDKGAALYWENALRGARNHIKTCHQVFRAQI